MPSDYANELMSKVGLDTTEWKKGVTELNAGIKHIETGFQATAALMDDWGSTSDGLKLRIESLNDKLTLQKKKLDILKKAYEEEVAQSGANSKASEELAKKMYAAKNEIERTKDSIEKYAKAEDETTRKTKTLITELEKSGKKFVDVGDKISSVGNKLTVGVTTPVVAAGTAIYKYSSNLTEAENKTEATFGFMSGAVKEWAKNSLDAFGMAKSTAYDAVSLYGDMATSMRLGKSAVADMSMSLVELSADLSSFRNVSLEQSKNALKGIFTGETESLKNLGIVMTETQLKAYALSQGFEKNYKDLTQAEKVQLRYQYVLEASKNAIGDYGRTNGEAAGQMKKLPEALKELASSFRDNVEPAITPVVTAINNAIVEFGKWDDSAKKTVVSIGLVAAAVGPLLTVTGKTITAAGKVKTAMASYRSTLLKKTQATVTDTQAETAHASALSKTGDAANIGSKGLNGMGKAASTAVPYILAVVAALALIGSEISRTINTAEKRIDEAYDKKTKAETDDHEKTIKNLQEEVECQEQSLDTQIQNIEEFYEKEISLLDNKLDASKKAIEAEQKAYKKAHEERLEQLEAERNLKLSNIDIEENEQVAALQKQINSLNALAEAEEKAEKERENQKKLLELQNAIHSASTYAEKLNAEKEYNEFVRELELEKAKEKRQLQIAELENEIEKINTESNQKREAINNEYEATVELENKKYDAYCEALDNRLAALDTYIETETVKLEDKRNSEIDALKSETSTYIAELNKRITKEEELRDAIIERLNVEKEEEKGKLKTFRGFLEEFGSEYNFPANANGTDYWRGGPTLVNEEGGEIMNLPRGTQIIPHDISMEIARAAGRAAVTNNSTVQNSYNYGAQQQVTVLQVGDRTVAKVITPQVSVGLSDDIYRRRRSGGAR